jgi:hypothetical protein
MMYAEPVFSLGVDLIISENVADNKAGIVMYIKC